MATACNMLKLLEHSLEFLTVTSSTLPNTVTKQYNLVPAKGCDLFGWESNRGPGGK